MTDPFPFDAAHVVVFHDACLDSGKRPDEEAPAHPPGPLWPWIEENHGSNARLQRDGRDAARFESQRREAIRRIDAEILARLPAAPGARLQSETPGGMIDRLSKLALEARQVAAQAAHGDDARGDPGRQRERLSALDARRLELAQRLESLLADCRAGRARFAAPPPS